MDLVIRDAAPDDAPEVLRLARGMWDSYDVEVDDGPWTDNFDSYFRANVGSPNYRTLVVDDPDADRKLIACGIGMIYEVTPAFGIPNGKMGFLQWFYTEPAWRGRGIATDIANQFLDWFGENGVTRAQLHAHAPAVPLYKRLGFQDTAFPNLWWAPDSKWNNDEPRLAAPTAGAEVSDG